MAAPTMLMDYKEAKSELQATITRNLQKEVTLKTEIADLQRHIREHGETALITDTLRQLTKLLHASTVKKNNAANSLCDLEDAVKVAQYDADAIAVLKSAVNEAVKSAEVVQEDVPNAITLLAGITSDTSESDSESSEDDEDDYTPLSKRFKSVHDDAPMPESKRGRKPTSPFRVKNGLVFEDGGVLHCDFSFTTVTSSIRIAHANYICNFYAKYANAKITTGLCKIVVPELNLPEIHLNAPTLKTVLHRLQRELSKKISKLEGRTYYAGLQQLNRDTWRLRLKREREPFPLSTAFYR
jgi:hypothetical protein